MSYLHSYCGAPGVRRLYITLIVSTFPNLSEGPLSLPSLKVRLYYNADFSTVNRRVLMFTKEAQSVHKICNKLPVYLSFRENSHISAILAFDFGRRHGYNNLQNMPTRS